MTKQKRRQVNVCDHFYRNASRLTGGGVENNMLFDATDFRRHLNRFFKTGKTKDVVIDGSTHWIFLRGGKQSNKMDSWEMRHQPDRDCHCTLYSLYYEIQGRYGLPSLDVIKYRRDYLHNLFKVYSGVLRMLQDKAVVAHMLKFKPWKRFGNFVKKEKLVEAALDNLKCLENLQDEESNRKRKQIKLF